LVTHAAALDVPRQVVEFLPRLPAAHRRGIGTPKGSRALGPFRQAVTQVELVPVEGAVTVVREALTSAFRTGATWGAGTRLG
jgi:hypothetical protein